MKHKILLLCHGYEAPFLSVAIQYVSFFKETDFEPVVVFIKGKPSSTVSQQLDAVEIIYLQASNKQLNGLKLGLINQLKRLHHQYHFEFAIAHRYKAIYMATHLKNLPVIGVAHIDGVFNSFLRKVYIRFQQKKLLLLGVSKAIRDDIQKNLPSLKPASIDYLYNSLNFAQIKQQQLSTQQARKALSLHDEDFLFLHVGRLHEDKDQKTLINGFSLAAANIPNAKLAIIGTGPLETPLKQLVQKLNLENRILFLGKIPDAYKYMRGFNGFILSSIREGLPVSLLEAFAADLICIASACNGNKEAIEDVGFSFNVGDETALAEHIQTVYFLSKSEQKDIHLKIQHKIDTHFTQQAVKEAFWNLSIPSHLAAKPDNELR